ncbi:hypothetical protein G9272_41005 [Streptomyces asoensis]|uniref:Uncharacterized protein n=1 Tax=Streptomyces asoensis TaxID=249586 RepID=A0A6M4X3A3_9ACTN|nr:hypothetical protein [Streptomyces asoensis]QJT07320.1 hypothetical protein G9272_41005 [Streptomyces asoensis]
MIEESAGSGLARVRAQELPVRPLRRETLRATQDRVPVITQRDAELPELPQSEGVLISRAVHRWRFESLSR